MLGQARGDIAVGEYMRRGLEPMAQRLQLDYEETFFTPPRTDAERAFYAYRCGESLVMSLTYPDGWATSGDHRDRSARKARKAAKRARSALLTNGGNAISYMTQRYASEMADFWRRASDDCSDESEAEALRDSARRSDNVSALAAEHWPIGDMFDVLPLVDQVAAHARSVFDPSRAQIDLVAYAGRTHATAGAAALLLGPEFPEFQALVIAPVFALDITMAIALQADWGYELDVWTNLLSDEPLAYAEVVRSS